MTIYTPPLYSSSIYNMLVLNELTEKSEMDLDDDCV